MPELGAQEPSGGNVGRRRFLLRAAGAGAVALAIPTIVTVTPAGAITSPPPQPPQVEPTGEVRPADPATGTQVAAATQGQLPFTGADVEKLVIAGGTAVVGGSALVYWSADKGAHAVEAAGVAPVEPPPAG